MSQYSTFDLLRGRYPENECVLMAEVSDASGFQRSRSADFIAVNLWNSRGLAIIGFEEKASRSDWLRELKNPRKQENIFQYCDYFYLITSGDKVAKMEEIPATWGWLHVQGNRIKTMKEAPKLTPIPVTRSFMCAMLRRAGSKEGWILRSSIDDKIEEAKEQAREYLQDQLHHVTKNYEELNRKVEAFQKESGITLNYNWGPMKDPAATGKAVKLLLEGGVEKMKAELEALKSKSELITNSIDNILKAHNGGK